MCGLRETVDGEGLVSLYLEASLEFADGEMTSRKPVNALRVVREGGTLNLYHDASLYWRKRSAFAPVRVHWWLNGEWFGDAEIDCDDSSGTYWKYDTDLIIQFSLRVELSA